MATQLQKKLRVLCLHGYRMNAKAMENQTRALRRALDDTAEFLFLNAPLEALGPTDPNTERVHGKDAPFYEWCRVHRADDTGKADEHFDLSVAVRSADKEWRFKYVDLDRMIEFMDEQLHKHDPFDVVLGFSQGAVVATMLSMLYLQRNERWWKLCVCVSGVPVRAAELQHLFEKPNGESILLPFPSVHIIGKSDALYPELVKHAAMYEEHPIGSVLPKLVFEHDGGHRFPSDTHNPGFYENLASIIQQHCGIEPTPKL